MRTVLGVIVAIGVVGGGAAFYVMKVSADPPANFRTTTVKRGDLQSSISATGTVEAEEFVDVGAQVTGPIKEFGVDPGELAKFKQEKKRDPTPEEKKSLRRIDYGSVVHEATILAQIDDSVYKARVDQAQSNVESAQARIVSAEAAVGQKKARLNQANQEWKRAQRLRPDRAAAEPKGTAGTGAPAQYMVAADAKAAPEGQRGAANDGVLEYRAMSDADYDSAKATYETALADVAAAEADLGKAKTDIKVADAALREQTTNLAYTTIRSPVEGVVVDRRVNVGQTVVGSFNAASVFAPTGVSASATSQTAASIGWTLLTSQHLSGSLS